MQSFSLVDIDGYPLDWKLLPYLQIIQSTSGSNQGFYIEAGANDGISQSNTALLEKKFGWKGLLIEPSPQAFEKCKRDRSTDNIFENCALVSNSSITTIKGDFWNGSLMSSVEGKRQSEAKHIEIPAFTLDHLLIKHNVHSVDFMSLDVEGYELEVLKGLDLNASYAPKVFLIELYPPEFEQVQQLLEQRYIFKGNFSNYNKIQKPEWDGTHNDYLFIRKDIHQ